MESEEILDQSKKEVTDTHKSRLHQIYKNELYILKEPRPLTEFQTPAGVPTWPSEFGFTLDAPDLKTDTVFIEESYAQRNPKPKRDSKSAFGKKLEPQTVYVAKIKKPKKKQQASLLENENTSVLKFESRFESGNLQEAIQTSDFSYELKLRKDLNTAGVPYRFKITNLMKPKCLYSEGMKPLLYSTVLADSIGKGWHRVGDDITYEENEDQEDGIGFIEFLLGNSKEAEYLRDNYVIKIIPMLNPDGVIVGNHRCNLNGFDLNRQWRDSPKQQIYAPEVWMVKQMILNTLKAREIALFCDMHGHNRKHGIFLYGCNNDTDPHKRYMERVFPYMLYKQCPSVFSFNRCQFQLQKKKEGTARIVMFKEFGILNSFTLEASFCGSIENEQESFHFNPNHLTLMGESIVKTLYSFFSQTISIEYTVVPLKQYQEIAKAIETKKPEFLPLPSDSEDTTSDDEELRNKVVKKKKVKVASKHIPKKTILSRPSSSAKIRKPSEPSVIVQSIESRPSTPISGRTEGKLLLEDQKPPKLPIHTLSIPDNVSVKSRPSSASNRSSVALPNNRQSPLSSLTSRKYFEPRHSSMPSIVIPVVTMVDIKAAVRSPAPAHTAINCSFPVGVTPDGNKTVRYKPGIRSKSVNDIHYQTGSK
ncbi:Cytosolic carboxypeptidase 3 [Boothiomyces macroporosus]|uniref:Cytosolic carboxypeptidase 3 n=1 Tax=Boothiomyces macroporosus TaxID=261099 RepID=A0AAD5UK97_9FUNG|nr:Cytosolic carboxypeptidase 3 [Boothiomyces macroporosus]